MSSSSIFWIVASVAGSPGVLTVVLAVEVVLSPFAWTLVTVVLAGVCAWGVFCWVVVVVVCAKAKLAPRKKRAQADPTAFFMEHS
jgi:hypothetical protein